MLSPAEDDVAIRNLSIPSGRNSFPFSIRLPSDGLPASFEDYNRGSVRYVVTITVAVKRTILNKNYKTMKFFTVTGPTVDLNSIPGMQVCSFNV